MRMLKAVGISIVIFLALVGCFQGYGSVKAVYADWVFLRQARLISEARVRQQAQQPPAPKPAPAPPVSQP